MSELKGSSASDHAPPAQVRRKERRRLRALRRATAFRTSRLWKTTFRPWLEYTVRFGFAIGAAVVIPLVLQTNPAHGPPRFTVGEQVVLGAIVLLVGLVLGNTFELKILANSATRRDADVVSEISRDNDLRRCLDGLEQVSRLDRSRLLELLLTGATHELGNSIKAVADTLEYELEPRIDETELMLQCSEGGSCQFTHYLDNTKFLIENQHSIEFWWNLDDAVVSEKALKKVERILLVNIDMNIAKAELDSDLNRLLIGAHLDNPECYECRILDVGRYEDLLKERFEAIRRLDCGLYANRFVYVSYQLPKDHLDADIPEVTGRLVAHPEKVEKYRRFLEECWDRAKTPQQAAEHYSIRDFTKNPMSEFLDARDFAEPEGTANPEAETSQSAGDADIDAEP